MRRQVGEADTQAGETDAQVGEADAKAADARVRMCMAMQLSQGHHSRTWRSAERDSRALYGPPRKGKRAFLFRKRRILECDKKICNSGAARLSICKYISPQ